MTMIIVSARIT